jgi:glycosyltransferase involved in cell wall biosynthesis
MESNTALTPLRASLSDALSSGHSLCAALDVGRQSLRVIFILPGLGVGGSGGSHSIYQEVRGLRSLGVDAAIALNAKAMERARAAYEDVDELFVPYRDVDDLVAITEGADVVSATHFKSVRTLAELVERRHDFLPAYYIQDYEPFFISKEAADIDEAVASYTLIRDCLLFAKTHWICNIVAERHGVRVAKVEPSIDEQLYRESGARGTSDSARIAAMIRPRTPRRQPTATIAALKAVSESLGSQVRITTFGCPPAELEKFTDHEPILSGHRGILSRAQVAELLGTTDVFLDLSMYQAFGRTALEAMACGATAVVPRLGGVWEFVEHRENAIAIDAFDTEQAVTAIAELVADRALLARLQAQARATASRYSILRASLSEYMLFAAEVRGRAVSAPASAPAGG